MLRYERAIRLKQEGFSYREIAEKMGIAVSTVKSYLYRRQHTDKLLEKQRKANRRHYLRHRDKILKRHKEYRDQNKKRLTEKRRRTVLQTKQGKITGLNKRAYPTKCELCGKEYKLLAYHHWDKNYNKGMWLDTGCHVFANRLEKGDAERYFALKNKIEQELEKFTEVERKQGVEDA